MQGGGVHRWRLTGLHKGLRVTQYRPVKPILVEARARLQATMEQKHVCICNSVKCATLESSLSTVGACSKYLYIR
jgi:hypothetical protein